MLAMVLMTLAAAPVQADAPVCREVNVQQANGKSRVALMCRGADGVWRSADAQPSAPSSSLSSSRSAATSSKGPCNAQQAKKSGLGSLMGKLAQDVMGRMKLPVSAQTRYSFNQLVSDAIACQLRPGERDRAAAATDTVVTKKVGSTVAWASDERPNVNGSSTVTGQTKLADGSICKDVRDVATIDGEETAVTKRMCRAPGAAGFSVVKADA